MSRVELSIRTAIALLKMRPRDHEATKHHEEEFGWSTCKLDDLPRRFIHAVGGGELHTALAQQPLPFIDIGAFHSDDDRHGHAEILDCRDDALRQDVAAQDAAENVDQNRFHLFVRHEDLEGVADLLGIRAAADVQEVRRLPSRQLDDVHRRHRQAGAVHHAADVAVEMDVIEIELRRFDLERILLAEIAQLLDVWMTIERVVVEGHFRVERNEIARGRDDERVDLEERRVRGEIRHVEGRYHADERIHLCAIEADTESELPRLERHDADARID